MFLVAPPPPPPPPLHANACTGHNFVTNTPIKFIFAIAIEVPDYKNLMIFGINQKNKMVSGGHFCIKMLKFRSSKRQPFCGEKKLHIDLKWREMQSKAIFGHPKMAARSHFVEQKKSKVAY